MARGPEPLAAATPRPPAENTPPRERVSARPAAETVRIEALKIATALRPNRANPTVGALLAEAAAIESWIRGGRDDPAVLEDETAAAGQVAAD